MLDSSSFHNLYIMFLRSCIFIQVLMFNFFQSKQKTRGVKSIINAVLWSFHRFATNYIFFLILFHIFYQKWLLNITFTILPMQLVLIHLGLLSCFIKYMYYFQKYFKLHKHVGSYHLFYFDTFKQMHISQYWINLNIYQ